MCNFKLIESKYMYVKLFCVYFEVFDFNSQSIVIKSRFRLYMRYVGEIIFKIIIFGFWFFYGGNFLQLG